MIERYTRPEMGIIWSEKNKVKKWLQVEFAVLEAQEDLGLIPCITSCVEPGYRNMQDPIYFAYFLNEIHEIEARTHHDVHAFVEACNAWLPENVKPYFHTGLTSYDIVDTALALILKESIELLCADIGNLIAVLRERALREKNTRMVGRTHGMHAEPITFGIKLLNWLDETERQQQEMLRCGDLIVGKISGAVGLYTLDPRVEKLACQKLNIESAKISTQIVARDRHANYIFRLSSIASSLEKFANNICNLQETEKGELEEPFKQGQAGSSAMPHKRNPHKCENICSLAREVRSKIVVALENQVTLHERDLKNSANERLTMRDASTLTDFMLVRFADIIKNLRVYPIKMAENLELTKGLIYSQGVMRALTNKGMTREQAYSLVQELALCVSRNNKNFEDIVLLNSEIAELLSATEIKACFNPLQNLKYVDEIFSRFEI